MLLGLSVVVVVNVRTCMYVSKPEVSIMSHSSETILAFLIESLFASGVSHLARLTHWSEGQQVLGILLSLASTPVSGAQATTL